MTTPTQTNKPFLPDAENFSLVLGGPLFQLLMKTRLADNGLQLVQRRVVVITLLLWLPLLLISLAQGRALLGSGPVPFFSDLELQVRFLVGVPLLILAEHVVHSRMRTVLVQFRERELVPEAARSQVEAAIAAAMRLRNSVVAEVSLIVLVYVVGVHLIWKPYVAMDTASWYATPGADGPMFSAAGLWYGYVSLPVFQFLLVRWYFRIAIWARFLWHVSKIELRLLPTHPDGLAGLGFLAAAVNAFAPIAAAHGAVVAGQLANRIFFLGAKLTDFKAQAFMTVLVMELVVFGPLLVFSPRLAALRRQGLREYGALAQRYVREFDAKWLRGRAPADEQLVGSGDIQSLADLKGSFEIVKGMRTVLVTREAAVRLALITLAPMVPLALTMMPLEDLLKQLLGILF